MPGILISYFVIVYESCANVLTESGLIVFKLIEGEFSETGGYIDVLMDDMAFPSYSSAKIKSKHMTFNEGRAVLRHPFGLPF